MKIKKKLKSLFGYKHSAKFSKTKRKRHTQAYSSFVSTSIIIHIKLWNLIFLSQFLLPWKSSTKIFLQERRSKASKPIEKMEIDRHELIYSTLIFILWLLIHLYAAHFFFFFSFFSFIFACVSFLCILCACITLTVSVRPQSYMFYLFYLFIYDSMYCQVKSLFFFIVINLPAVYCVCMSIESQKCCGLFASLWLSYDDNFNNWKLFVFNCRICYFKIYLWGKSFDAFSV